MPEPAAVKICSCSSAALSHVGCRLMVASRAQRNQSLGQRLGKPQEANMTNIQAFIERRKAEEASRPRLIFVPRPGVQGQRMAPRPRTAHVVDAKNFVRQRLYPDRTSARPRRARIRQAFDKGFGVRRRRLRGGPRRVDGAGGDGGAEIRSLIYV